MKEIWKDISGYEGYYQISNLGNVKSLTRKHPMIRNGKGRYRTIKEKILKLDKDRYGYLHCILYKNSIRTNKVIHKLVWDAFIKKKYNTKTHSIDHIDDNKTNNKSNNLQLLTNRENISKGKLINKKNDLPTGVTKVGNRYVSRMQVNKKTYNLGTFSTVKEAKEEYKKFLSKLV